MKRRAPKVVKMAAVAVEDNLVDDLARAGMQVGNEALEDVMDLGDGLIAAPAPNATMTVAMAALFILVPLVPALVGTLHMMGASARGIGGKQRRQRLG